MEKGIYTNHAIQVLTERKLLLEKVINQSNWEGYSEALKDRKQKIKDIELALKQITR